MKSILSNALTCLFLAGWCGGVALAQSADVSAKSDRLAVCFDEENPPFSAQADGAGGIDVEVAQAIASVLQRRLSTAWVLVPVRGGIEKALKQNLQGGKCDAYFGVPIGEGSVEELRGRAMVASSPYVTGRYVLAANSKRQVRSPADMRNARRIGVVTATPADLYLHKEGLKRFPYGNNKELIAALLTDEVDAALIWSPALARAHKDGSGIAAEAVAAKQPDDPLLQTRFAIVMRETDKQLRSEIDDAIARLSKTGELAAIMQRNGLPGAVPTP